MVWSQATGSASAPASDVPRDMYLAGLPCRARRSPTRAEFFVLAFCGYGGAGAATLGAAVLLEAIFHGGYGFRSDISLLIAGFSAVSLTFAALLTRPALRTLRRGTVTVFTGELPDLKGFDQNQKTLCRSGIPFQEVVLMADGRTPLRVDNRWLFTTGKLIRPARIARDRGPETRPLSPEELLELRDLVKHYRIPSASVIMPLLYGPMVALGIAPCIGIVASSNILLICFEIVICAVAMQRYGTYASFAKRLGRDVRDGVLTNGNLWSGTPWLVNGEPAPWRLARPKVGCGQFDAKALTELGN